MTRLYCLFWYGGSCGDILQNILSMHPDVFTGATYSINSRGRSVPHMMPEFLDMFPVPTSTWLWRKWSEQDCEQLINQSHDKIIVIGTHEYEQVSFLKNYLGSQIETIGIVYDQLLWPFVLKNFCYKVTEIQNDLNQQYQTNHPELYKKFKKHEAIGAWTLSDQLKHDGNWVPKVINYKFDHTIRLDLLLNNDLQWLTQFLRPDSEIVFQTWLNKQNILYRVQLPANADYDACLGRNPQATEYSSAPITLDIYDKIFINHYIKKHNLPPCKANTHQELLDFFNKAATKITIQQG